MQLGEMQVIGSPPAKLGKALAVIADTLHPAFAHDPRITPGISKESCVLCSQSMTAIVAAPDKGQSVPSVPQST